jgi:hypothetical protein
VHQVGLKNPGSQNFRTLAFKGEASGVTQIYPTTAATARDRRKIMFFSHKKVLKPENQQSNISFFMWQIKNLNY